MTSALHRTLIVFCLAHAWNCGMAADVSATPAAGAPALITAVTSVTAVTPVAADAAVPPDPAAEVLAAEQLAERHKRCRPLTDQAVSADIKAALAQSQKKELQEIARLYDDSLKLWTAAADACEGNDRERARRNLADTNKARDAVSLAQGAGVQCESSNRDALAMHDLARQASTEKRWPDAAILFRKTADMWDMASERCSGPQARQAQTRRDQSAIDAHNAEFCAPLFEQARDRTQHLKNTEAGAATASRQDLSRTAETAWREAASQCQGSAAEVAVANAQRLARERGTPLPGSIAQQDRKPAATAAAAVPATPARTPAAPTPEAGQATASAAQGLQVTVPGVQTERMAGTTRLIGQFKSGPDGAMLNGIGKVIWENGSVFEGAMVDGQRTGKGKFVWPNGQSFEGEWRDDTPMGNGVLRFANGDRYEGPVVAGSPQGSGKMQYAQGDAYTGEFRGGQPDGRGTFIWKNGNRYTGQWVAGLRQGNGIYTWSNGDQWVGVFSRNEQTADGKLLRKSEQPAPAGVLTASDS